MNKAALIEQLAERTSASKKQAEEMVDELVNTVIEELKKGNKVSIVGFGSFEAKTRHARGGINPQNPTERITIPEVTVAKFKTGKTLKDALKGKDQDSGQTSEVKEKPTLGDGPDSASPEEPTETPKEPGSTDTNY